MFVAKALASPVSFFTGESKVGSFREIEAFSSSSNHPTHLCWRGLALSMAKILISSSKA